MKLTSFTKFATLAAVLLAGSAHASIVHYDMTFTGGNTASITFDDSTAAIGNGPFAAGATAYGASSFIINGANIANGEVVIYNNYSGSYDWAYFTNSSGGTYIQLGGHPGIFSSEAATQMTDRTFADFGGASNSDNVLDTGETMTSLISAGEVPEPASLALLGMGLAGLAAARRRKVV